MKANIIMIGILSALIALIVASIKKTHDKMKNSTEETEEDCSDTED